MNHKLVEKTRETGLAIVKDTGTSLGLNYGQMSEGNLDKARVTHEKVTRRGLS